MIYNLILALSNFIALPISYFVKEKYILYIPMMGSFLYHLAERKHGLPGIYPFNLLDNILLWIDRIGACFASGYILIMMYKFPELLGIMPYLIVAVICLLYSEKVIINKIMGRMLFREKFAEFFVPHLAWHLLGFVLLGWVIIHAEKKIE